MSAHFWLADGSGRLLETDPGLGVLLGYTPDQLRAFVASDLEADLVLLPYSKVYQRQAIYKKKDGSCLPMRCATHYSQGDGGRYFTILEPLQVVAAKAQPTNDAVLMQLVLDSQPSKILLFDLDYRVLWLNSSACKSFTREVLELLGKKCQDLWSECSEHQCSDCPLAKVFLSKKPEQQNRVMQNNRKWRVTTVPVFDADQKMQSILFIGDDITEYLIIDKEMRRSHKLESLGTLAGGIAHDFNNILSGITGYTELALDLVKEDGALRQYLLELSQAGKRAAGLVKQILTFTRRGEGKLVRTEIPAIAKEVLQLLRSTLPSTIELERHIDDSVAPVLADPVQIHQIIMNLCTNAGHAMEGQGGVLSLSIARARLSADFFEHHRELLPGEYLQLEVSDTGCGMNQSILASIFDPYFTTKPPSQGTGLGLSVVHGIVKDCGGTIRVESQEGRGSTFTILLPTVAKKTAYATSDGAEEVLCGGETIMLVDDEPVVLDVTKKYLEIQGYHVETFSNSLTALNVFKDKPEKIDLLISDVTMPNLTGDRLAAEVFRIRKDLPILLMTGYTDLVSEEMLQEIGVQELFMKPPFGKAFLSTIRRLLDEAKK